MTERYAQSTRVLKIPVRKTGESLDSRVELKKYQMIENILLSSNRGMRNGVYAEGIFSVVKDASVLLSGITHSAIKSCHGSFNSY